MGFRLLLAMFFGNVVSGILCPAPLSVTLQQSALAPRPGGEVLLICDARGVSSDPIDTVSMLIMENDALYTIWMSDKKQKLSIEHEAAILNHAFVPLNGGIQLKLWLNIKLTDRNNYMCQLQTQGRKICSEATEIKFEEPKLILKFDRKPIADEFEPRNAISVNITCFVNAALGRPQMQIWYAGSYGSLKNEDEVIFERTEPVDHGYYFQVTKHVVMHLPTKGHIICSVTDNRGNYITSEPVVTTTCPTPVSVKVRQNALVTRPKGDAVLTCDITGVSSTEVDYYWWLAHESNTPIFIFSEKYDMNGIQPGYGSMVTNESHVLSGQGITSKLNLNANINNDITYACDAAVKDLPACKKTIPILFEDPMIYLTFDREPVVKDESQPGALTDVICAVTRSAGKPQMSLSYEGTGSKQVEIIKEYDIELENYVEYFRGVRKVIMRLPSAGLLKCHVTDNRGVYTVMKNFTATAPSSETSSPTSVSENKLLVAAIVVPIVVALILSVVAFMVCRSNKPKYSRQLSEPPDPDSEPLQRIPAQQGIWWAILRDGASAIDPAIDMSDIHWTPIQELSKKPVLYTESHKTSDVHQNTEALSDSWFLAALTSLCVAYKKTKGGYFDSIFKDVDLNLQQSKKISLHLWRYGNWEAINVEPYVPTSDGEICIVHSEDRTVFWSTLVQMAYAKIFRGDIRFDGNPVIHVLEALTGGVVVTHSAGQNEEDFEDLWETVKYAFESGYPIACKAKPLEMFSRGTLYCSIVDIEVEESTGTYSIKIRLFHDDDDRQNDRIAFLYKNKEATRGVDKTGFWLRFPVFTVCFEEIYILYTNEVVQYRNGNRHIMEPTAEIKHGVWKQPSYCLLEQAEYWKHPQYLITFDSQHCTGDTTLLVALMQQEQLGSTYPLAIGYDLFKVVCDRSDLRAFQKKTWEIKDIFPSPPKKVRQVVHSHVLSTQVRYLLIPHGSQGSSEANFLLRFYAEDKNVVTIEELPPGIASR